MRKEVVYVSSALIVIVILLAVFLIPVGDQQFTGRVVIGEYTTEADCVGEGYTWEELTEQNCTVETTCVNETIDCEPCLEYEDLNGTQGDCITLSSCVEEVCTDEENCVDEVVGGQCIGDVCDSAHLTLCDDTNCETDGGGYWYDSVCNAEAELSCSNDLILCNETECTEVGYWYDGVCNAEAECIPETSCGSSCGDISDGCGGTLNCGACDSETGCVEDWECGSWSDCVDEKETRTCEDLNDCGTEEDKLVETKSCGEEKSAATPSTGSSVDDILKELEEQGILEGSQEQSSSQEQSALTGGAIEQINLSECAGCMLNEKCYRFDKRKNQTYCTEYGTWLPQKDINQTCSENFECESRNCDDGQCDEFNLLKAIIDWFRNLFKGSGSLDNNSTALLNQSNNETANSSA